MKIRFSALAILLKAMAHRQSWRGPTIPCATLKYSSHAKAQAPQIEHEPLGKRLVAMAGVYAGVPLLLAITSGGSAGSRSITSQNNCRFCQSVRSPMTYSRPLARVAATFSRLGQCWVCPGKRAGSRRLAFSAWERLAVAATRPHASNAQCLAGSSTSLRAGRALVLGAAYQEMWDVADVGKGSGHTPQRKWQELLRTMASLTSSWHGDREFQCNG